MEEEGQLDIGRFLDIARRRKGLILMMMAALLTLGLMVAFALPPVYRAQATILIEQPEIPKDFVRSMITGYADQRLEMIHQRVIATSNLLEIVKKHDLYKEQRKNKPLEEAVDAMRNDIKLEKVAAEVLDPANGRPTKATIAFTLSYDNRSPRMALDVANDLVSSFLNENIKTRTEVATRTSAFFTDEANKLADRIKELEARLAAFKEKNSGKLPEQMNMNLQLLDRAEQDIVRIDTQLQSLEERKAHLEADMARLKPNSSLISETGERILGPADRLKVSRTEYLRLSARYSERHPDVMKLKKEIESLQREVGGGGYNREAEVQLNGQRAELAELRKRYSSNHPDVKRLEQTVSALEREVKQTTGRRQSVISDAADNPAYFQAKANLEAVNGQISIYRRQQDNLRTKISNYEAKLQEAPNVEQVYNQLTREYEGAVLKHKEIVAKQMEAQVSQTLETERKGERFTLIEPPLYPDSPAKPPRLVIVLLSVILSVAGGIGAAVIAEALDQSVRGSDGILQILNIPPLGIIPPIDTETDVKRQAVFRTSLALGSVMGLLVLLTVVHVSLKPLDVIWYQTLSKLGVNTEG